MDTGFLDLNCSDENLLFEVVDLSSFGIYHMLYSL